MVPALMTALPALGSLGAQAPGSARCDSIVSASGVDTVPVAIFVRTTRLDGALQAGQSKFVSEMIATAFVPPRPFRVSVFSGGPQMRAVRRTAPDSVGVLREPTITGVYRYTSTKRALVGRVETVRTSLVPGFDSSVTEAIRSATGLEDVRSMAEGDADSMRVEVRFATDSVGESYRVASAAFPRMPVVDAVPRRDNPPPEFPTSASADSGATGQVVLRFVVDLSGEVIPGTIEVSRATSLDFLKSALTSLPAQRFAPATIRGCPVAQLVDYSFSFMTPPGAKPPTAGAWRRD
jgi:hypothetical protein